MPTDPPTDLTALREAWEADNEIAHRCGDYVDVKQDGADDLARRAYDAGYAQGVADWQLQAVQFLRELAASKITDEGQHWVLHAAGRLAALVKGGK